MLASLMTSSLLLLTSVPHLPFPFIKIFSHTPTHFSMLDLAVAIPTLVGSILSMFAAGFIFLCYFLLPSQQHFRHTLILNLAFAGKLYLFQSGSHPR